MGAPDPVHQFPETTVLPGNSKVQPKPSDVERAIEQMTDDTQGLHPTLVNHQGDYHPHQRQVVQQHLDKMLRNGIIEPSKGPWSSPVVLVKKKKVRPQDFVDFRKVNDLTKKDAGLMTHDSLGGAQWFSTLDLASVYWQVEVDSADRENSLCYSRWSLSISCYAFWAM